MRDVARSLVAWIDESAVLSVLQVIARYHDYDVKIRANNRNGYLVMYVKDVWGNEVIIDFDTDEVEFIPEVAKYVGYTKIERFYEEVSKIVTDEADTQATWEKQESRRYEEEAQIRAEQDKEDLLNDFQRRLL